MPLDKLAQAHHAIERPVLEAAVSSGKDYKNIFSLKMVGMMYLCCMYCVSSSPRIR